MLFRFKFIVAIVDGRRSKATVYWFFIFSMGNPTPSEKRGAPIGFESILPALLEMEIP